MSPLLLSKQLEPKGTLGSEELLVSRRPSPATEFQQAFSSAAPGEEDGCFFNGCKFTFQPPAAEGRSRMSELWPRQGGA